MTHVAMHLTRADVGSVANAIAPALDLALDPALNLTDTNVMPSLVTVAASAAGATTKRTRRLRTAKAKIASVKVVLKLRLPPSLLLFRAHRLMRNLVLVAAVDSRQHDAAGTAVGVHLLAFANTSLDNFRRHLNLNLANSIYHLGENQHQHQHQFQYSAVHEKKPSICRCPGVLLLPLLFLFLVE